MPTIEKTVYVDVDFGAEDFDNDELIEELEYRGYVIYKKEKDPRYDLEEIKWNIDRGNLKEALILLERELPALKGIARLN